VRNNVLLSSKFSNIFGPGRQVQKATLVVVVVVVGISSLKIPKALSYAAERNETLRTHSC